MLLEFIDRRPHLRVTLEYLVEEVASDDIDTLLVELELARQNLLLQFHWVILLLEGK